MRRRQLCSLACSVLCLGIVLMGTGAQALVESVNGNSASYQKVALSAQASASYIDENHEQAFLTEPYTVVGDTTAASTWKDGWYVVEGPVNITDTVTVEGDVKLILCDGAQLTTRNICVNEGNAFSVYCQSAGTGSLPQGHQAMLRLASVRSATRTVEPSISMEGPFTPRAERKAQGSAAVPLAAMGVSSRSMAGQLPPLEGERIGLA